MELIKLDDHREDKKAQDERRNELSAKFRELADRAQDGEFEHIFVLGVDSEGDLYRYVTFTDRLHALGALEMFKQGVNEL